jgi:syntaxin 1B/2/3
MFIELSGLVHLQGEIVDNIFDNISHAKDNVFHGEEDILKSKHHMDSARKKKCIIMIVVIVVVLVILGPVLGFKLSSA